MRPIGPQGHRKQRPATDPALFLCVGDSPARPLHRVAASSILSSLQQGPGAAIFPRTQLVPGGTASPLLRRQGTAAPPGQSCRVLGPHGLGTLTPRLAASGKIPARPRPIQVASDMCSEGGRAPAAAPVHSSPPWYPIKQAPHPPFVNPMLLAGQSRAAGQREKKKKTTVRPGWHAAARTPR